MRTIYVSFVEDHPDSVPWPEGDAGRRNDRVGGNHAHLKPLRDRRQQQARLYHGEGSADA